MMINVDICIKEQKGLETFNQFPSYLYIINNRHKSHNKCRKLFAGVLAFTVNFRNIIHIDHSLYLKKLIKVERTMLLSLVIIYYWILSS